MANTYSLAPVPKWYIADLVGKPLAGGYLATFSSLDHTSVKLVYQDEDGLEPWPYVSIPNVGSLGILFDENGAQGPFYFQFNDAVPDNLYYLEVYDANGVLQWTIDDFTPATGGGGSVVTSTKNVNNILINNVFWRNLLQNAPPFEAIAPNVFKVLAPGAHAGFSDNYNKPLGTGFYTGPDIVFIKSNNNATDTISFPLFTPTGGSTLTNDVTPNCYFRYICSSVGAGAETQKCVQFPVVRNVQNLANQPVTITFWAKSNGITSTLLVQWFSFYGDGTASAPLLTPIQTISNLNTSWQKFTVPTSVPSAVGKTLGLCNNDATFLQFQLPLSSLCDISFTKPYLCLGTAAPAADFQTYDEIDSLINSPRTGNIKVSFDPIADFGYIPMNDGTIGQTGSAATTYAGNDVFPLYNFLYQNVIDTWAPVSGGRTGNAVNDFTIGKVMTLPKALGRAISQAGIAAGSAVTTWALGQNGGQQTPTIALNQLPDHQHLSPAGTQFTLNAGGPSGLTSGSSVTQLGNTGGVQGFTAQSGFDVTQPSIFMNYFIKL